MESFHRLKDLAFSSLFNNIKTRKIYSEISFAPSGKVHLLLLIPWYIAVRICITHIVIQSSVSNVYHIYIHETLILAVLKTYSGIVYPDFYQAIIEEIFQVYSSKNVRLNLS